MREREGGCACLQVRESCPVSCPAVKKLNVDFLDGAKQKKNVDGTI